MEIRKVGVLGCGLMGSGIVEVAAIAGFEVVVREVDEALLDAGRARVRASLDRAVAKGKLAAADRDAATARIGFTMDLAALADRDLVIEAVVEDLDTKRELFKALDGLCARHTLLATNTSSLTVVEIAAATQRPDRVLGLHFFNPVPVMKLVEVVRTLATSEETFATGMAFARALGKEPVATKDTSGFVVNLLLVPYLLDAIRAAERGVASIPDIDRGMVLGCDHPMGPLTLCDFVGNDTLCRIAEILYAEYRESRYAPPPLLKRLVAMGRLGRKAGRGFYDYSADPPVALSL
ncbi:MAG: 3-hydroxybutyryl-CoA dehydrogenase [Gemmatimonadetes bacterium]|nr:3-hydroxybutyryl-CoA dehydrogenase [Gemmatimonadota bacterium]